MINSESHGVITPGFKLCMSTRRKKGGGGGEEEDLQIPALGLVPPREEETHEKHDQSD